MPGSAISQLLSSQTYESFFHLYHWYSEEFLRRAVTLYSSGQIIGMFTRQLPADGSERLKLLNQAAHQLETTARQLEAQSLRFFWPLLAGETESEEAFHAAYQRWWHPYSSAVWDRFFDNAVESLGLPVNQLVGVVQQLYLLSSHRLPEAQSGDTRSDYRRINQIAIEAAHRCDDLRAMLDPDSLDRWVTELMEK